MTTYEKWISGQIGNFGSFHTTLLNAYRLADGGNRESLEKAFPEWFTEKGEATTKATHITKKGFGRLLKEGTFCTVIKTEEEGKVLIKIEGGLIFKGNLSDLIEIPNI